MVSMQVNSVEDQGLSEFGGGVGELACAEHFTKEYRDHFLVAEIE